MHFDFMSGTMRPGAERELTSRTLEGLFAEMADADMFLEVKTLTPTSATNPTFEVSQPHMNGTCMISQMRLTSKTTAAARFQTGKRTLLVMYDANVTRQMVLLAERGGTSCDFAPERTEMSFLHMKV